MRKPHLASTAMALVIALSAMAPAVQAGTVRPVVEGNERVRNNNARNDAPRATSRPERPAQSHSGRPSNRGGENRGGRDGWQGYSRPGGAQRPDAASQNRGDRPGWNRGGDNRGENRGNWNRGDNRGSGGWQRPGRDNDGRPGGNRNDRENPRDNNWQNRPGNDRNDRWNNNNRNDRGNWNRPGNDRGNWSRPDNRGNWDRNRGGNRHGWQSRYRYNWHNHRDFRSYSGVRLGFYFAPRYGYYQVPTQYYGRRYSYGDSLPRYFYSYRVYDPAFYFLPPKPYGCEYFFVGNDIVLVDMDSGYILDVFYDVF